MYGIGRLRSMLADGPNACMRNVAQRAKHKDNESLEIDEK